LLLATFVLVGAIGLVWAGGRREASVLVFAFAAAAFAIAAVKLTCMGCHAPIPWLTMHSPSGHAAITTGTVGAAALLAIRRQNDWPGRVFWAACALIIIAGVAASRVLLGMHTRGEVLVGLGLGAIIVALCWRMLRDAPRVELRTRLIAAPLVMAVILFHGVRMPAETVLQHLAGMLSSSVAICAE
jgi:membrane-associated phospholipid phosphatase